MNEQHVNLDVSKSQGQTQVVRIGQGDKAGTTIVAHVYDNGTELDMTGMTARFEYRLPYSAGYVQDEHVTVNGSTLTYVVDEEHCAAVAGVTEEAYFSIMQGSNVIASTSRFSVRVLRAASKGSDPAGTYTDDVAAATRAAREAADAATEAIEQIGTAVDDAQQAAEDAAQAVTDAQTAIQDADAAKQSATTAANQATAAANNANSKANAANTAANNANAATSAANDATTRANAAIDAMGDISEQAVPVMSADVRGGAKIQPDSGLEIAGTDNLQVRLALESEGDVRGGLAQVTAKGHAEQDGTPTPDNPVPIQVVRGRNLVSPESKHDGYYVDYGTNTIKTAAGSTTYVVKVERNTDYVLTFSGGNRTRIAGIDTGTISDGTPCEILYQADANYTPRIFNSGNHDYVAFTTNNAQAQATDVQLTLGSTPQPYVPYGRVGMEVQSRNLLDISPLKQKYPNATEMNGVIMTVMDDGAIHASGTSVGQVQLYFTINGNSLRGFNGKRMSGVVISGCQFILELQESPYTRYAVDNGGGAIIANIPPNVMLNAIFRIPSGKTLNDIVFKPMISDEDIPYTPYFEPVTTPIPLPQRGWVGSLPDGTADVLTLDGAGKVTWEKKTNGTAQAVTDGVSATVGVDAMSSTGQIADGATVLYKLATPVTEDCGYCEDWPTDIPEGATVTIRELDSVGIKYFIDSGVTELAKQWYARARSEYEDRITALEQAVAELATS